MNATPAKISVWESESGDTIDVMRAPARKEHWTRHFFSDWAARKFGKRHFQWLDVGIQGMVDYEKLRREEFDFTFTGVDVGPFIVEDAKTYLKKKEDRVLLLDIDSDVIGEELQSDFFDLATARHVINHCRYYETPVANLVGRLRPGGILFVTLHLHLLDDGEELHETYDEARRGWRFGHYYNKARFLNFINTHAQIEQVIRFDDGVKPNDVVIARKREPAAPPAPIPEMQILHPDAHAATPVSRVRTFLDRLVQGIARKVRGT